MKRIITIGITLLALAGFVYVLMYASQPDTIPESCVFADTFTCSRYSYDPQQGIIAFTLRNDLEQPIEISEIIIAGPDIESSPDINTSTCRSEPERTIEPDRRERFTITAEGCRSQGLGRYQFHVEAAYSSQGGERTSKGEIFVRGAT